MCHQSAVTTSQSKSYILQRLVSLACYRLVFFIFGKPILDRTNSTHHYTNWIMDHTFTLCQLFFAGHITSRLNVTLFWRTSDTVLSQDPLLIHSLLTDLRLLLTKIRLGLCQVKLAKVHQKPEIVFKILFTNDFRRCPSFP